MLATCVVNGWDLATYRDPDHPLQAPIAETLAELAGEPVARDRRRRLRRPGHGRSRWPGWPGPSAGSPPRADGTPEAEVAAAIRAFPEYRRRHPPRRHRPDPRRRRA